MNLLLLAISLAASNMQSGSASVPEQSGAGQTPGGAAGTPVAPPPTSNSATPVAAVPSPSASGAISSYPASFFASAEVNTAREMLDRLPGFTFDDGTSARGFDAAAGNVLIDGHLPTSKSDDLDSVLRRLPASQVERIDVIRGGAAGIDMHGKTLVANVVRKSGTANSGNIQVSDRWITSDGRQMPSIRVDGSHQAGGRTIEGSLAYGRLFGGGLGSGTLVERGPDGDLRGAAGDDAQAGGRQAAATAAFSGGLAGGKFRLNLSLQHQTYAADEIVNDRGLPAISPFDEHDTLASTLGELGMRYTRDIARGLSLETVIIEQLDGASASTRFASLGDIQQFSEHHRNGETVGRTTLTWQDTSKLTIEGGLETAYNWLHSHTAYTDDGVAIAVPAANVEVTEKRAEAFAKASWTPSPKLNIEAGMREEVSRIASSGDVSLAKTLRFAKPSIAVVWSPADGKQIRARVAREVDQLDFNDFVAAASFSTGQVLAGNPNLIPQQGIVLEAAFEQRLLTDGAATITLRHTMLNDVIDRAPVIAATGFYDTPANIGDGHKDEAIADLNLPLRRMGIPGGLLKASLTWRRSSVRDPNTGQLRAISGLPAFEGTIGFSQDLPRSKLTWGGQVDVGATDTYYRFNQIETDVIPVTGQVYIEAKPWARWSIRAELSEIGGGSSRRLTNWSILRTTAAYDERDVRNLNFGPLVRLRLRRDW